MAGACRTSPGVVSEDIFEFHLADSPRISPDGRRIAWVDSQAERLSNSYRSVIQVTDCETGVTRPLTAGPRDTNPSWSPDGSMLAFVSRRSLKMGGKESGAAQVYVMKADGGEAWPVSDLRSGAGAPQWSPDGRHIAFTVRLDQRRGLQRISDPDATDSDAYLKFNDDVLVIRRRKWKSNGVGFIAHLRSQVIIVDVTSGPEAERPAPRLAIGGDFDVTGFCWDPTGTKMAFVKEVDPEPGKGYVRCAELWAAYLDQSPASTKMLLRVRRLDGKPSWSPDGKSIAILGHDNPRGSAAHSRMLTLNSDGGNFRCLTPGLDRSLGDSSVSDTRTASTGTGPVWCDSGKTLMAQINDAGKVQLVKVPFDDGEVRWLTQGEQQILDFSVSASTGRIATVVSEALNPSDIYVSGPNAENPKRLTSINEKLLGQRTLCMPERFTVRADDGEEIEGWVMRPLCFEEGRKFPAILEIHGGPVRHYGYNYFHELQLLSARGYTVIFGNPRGSQGYGEEFCAAIKGNHGDRDYRDIMQFVDGAALQFSFIDLERMGVAGGSYGGFMTNWIIGHTDRFKAAVTMRSVVNNYTEFGTGDRGYQREADAGGGGPWENAEGYMRTSPIKYIGACTTPTMIIHSEQDYRCPVDQGELLYAALFRLGVPTEFVRFPGENHELSRSGKPWHRVFRLNKILEWFDRWLKTE